MFDLLLSSPLVPVIAVGVSVSAFFAVLGIAYSLTPKADRTWKDPMPSGFYFAVSLMRPLMPALPVPDGSRRVIQAKLYSAGLAYAIRPEEIIACRWCGGLIGFGSFVLVGSVLGLSWQMTILLALVSVGLGFRYTDIVLRDRIKKRHHLIQKEFPFFLDLLLLCLKVGLTFTAALEHTIAKMSASPLREELERAMRDIRTGVPRRDALSRMSERIDLPAVTNFVGAVNQSEESGAPLTDTLAAQAEQRLEERFQKAEEQANKAPVKLMFPLVAFLLPTTLIIIFFPIAVKLFTSGATSFF